MLIQTRLHQVLDYDPITGVFQWATTRGSRAPKGSVAGSHRADGYVDISIDGVRYKGHRLAWLYAYGVFPNEIDHRDGNRANNAIGNLREATRTQNNGNSQRRTNNTSGYKGVSFCKQTGKWRASIKSNNKQRNLGRFNTLAGAVAAYDKAARIYFGEFARTNK